MRLAKCRCSPNLFMSNMANARLIAIVWSDRALKAFSVAYKTISLCSAVLATWCGLHNDCKLICSIGGPPFETGTI